ncbi:MAG: thiamine diphosphokinase [Ardenticatenaceae bacterium]|nr:thiamine diphosphokinase [Anaerolineales bacterium]MCB8968972.1 thiamine diphosphokinase [Ardenticatenaceae bacterium]MCB8989277.1 thiamine diphosphokinase [Ardenticatenaceae bacterium]
MTVLLFANGDMAEVEWIRPYLAQATAIIAADGGARHVLALGLLPDVVVGDMDSLPAALQAPLAQQRAGGRETETAVPRFIVYPTHKDETDLELALTYAAQVYAGELWLFGAFGGRVDQFLANIFLLAHPTLNGRLVRFFDQYQCLWLLDAAHGAVEIHGRVGDTVSLLPLGADAIIERTSGLQWPLHHELLAFGPARGISNRMTEDVATVVVGNGRLLCIHTQQSWQR